MESLQAMPLYDSPGLTRSCLDKGVRGRAPLPALGVMMLRTSVSGLTRERGVCRQGVEYCVFSRICHTQTARVNMLLREGGT